MTNLIGTFPLLMATASVIAGASASRAQQPRITMHATEPPYYANDTIELQIRVAGIDEKAEPTARATGPVHDGVTVRFAGVTASRAQSIQIINGRTMRQSSTTWNCLFQIRADHAGTFRVGPFEIVQGKETYDAEAVEIEFQETAIDDRMLVDFHVPQRSFVVGEEIPATLRWGYQGGVNISQMEIDIPAIQAFDVRIEQLTGARGELSLPIRTKDGIVRAPTRKTTETIDGKSYQVYTSSIYLRADQPHDEEFGPPIAVITRVVGGRRDPFDLFFGNSNSGARAERLKAIGKPIDIQVLAPPIAGRPDSFSGAVGTAFSIDIEAARTVVRVGEPVPLHVTLHGPHLAGVHLPRWTQGDRLPTDRFRLSGIDGAGALTENEKKFTVTLRVLDPTAGEFPTLPFSWYDPERNEYRTANSEPFALRVLPTETIDADQVVSSQPAATPNQVSELDDRDGRDESAGRDAITASRLQGADLALVAQSESWTRSRNPITSKQATTAVYVCGLGLLLLAELDRRRRNVDPTKLAQRSLFREIRQRVEQAGQLERKLAAEEIANALQKLLSDAPANQRATIQTLIAELEAEAYNPSANRHHTTKELQQRALAIVSRQIRENR